MTGLIMALVILSPLLLYGLIVLQAKAYTAQARAGKARKRIQRAEEAQYLKW